MEVSRAGFSAVIGNGHGMQFPLEPHTDVVLANIHGQDGQSFILGALYHDDHVNPVTAHNPFHHVIKTSIGNLFLMDDDPVAPNILFETANQENQLKCVGGEVSPGIMLCSQTGAIKMDAVGDIMIEAAQDISVSAKESFMMTAASWMISAAESGLSFDSMQDIEIQAGEDWDINVAGDIGLRIEGEGHHTVMGAFDMCADQDMTLKSESGRLAIAAEGQHPITVSSLEGTIMFRVGDSEIVLNQDGTIAVSGRQITMVAPEVSLNGEIV
jgi:hypothetical protein